MNIDWQKTLTVLLLVCISLSRAGLVLANQIDSVSSDAPGDDLNEQPVLHFCYEDKQLLPYYTGNSNTIPAYPGATIEHLQQAGLMAGITIKLSRMPWLRCLQQLETNQIDALVAAYTKERAHYTYFPKNQDGMPDTSLAINTNALCLAHRFDNDLKSKMTDPEQPLTISRPYGYRAIPLPAHAALVGAHSPEQALELVVSGRVDATTVTCEINGLPGFTQKIATLPLRILRPPVYLSTGYLMLSQQFYLKYPDISQQLWQALPAKLDRNRYIEYLSYPLNFIP